MSKLDKLKTLVQNDRISRKEGIFSEASGKIYDIEIAKIKTNPFQPRLEFNEAEIDELAQSIDANGLLQPIIVSQESDHYILIAGERRLKATQKLGKTTISSIIFEKVSHEKLATFAITENLERIQLDPIEVALIFHRLLEEKIFNSQSEITKSIGISKSRLSKLLSIAKLDPDILSLLKKYNYKDVEVISQIKTLYIKDAKELLELIQTKNLSRNEAIQAIKLLLNNKKARLPIANKTIGLKKRKNKYEIKVNLSNLTEKHKKEIEKKLASLYDFLDSIKDEYAK